AELDHYRERVDRFVADLDQEYYDHFAGLKVDFDLESIYERYDDITTLEQAQRIGRAGDGSFRSTELWRFACENYIGGLTRRYGDAVDRLFRSRAGVSLDEAQRWDTARVFRAPEWDDFFPADQMLPALEGTLSDLGVDLKSQENVHIDSDEREHKTPRAFCAPIEVPGKVMLVIRPMGGCDDWRAFFHEAGHAEHFANTRPERSVDDLCLGKRPVT